MSTMWVVHVTKLENRWHGNSFVANHRVAYSIINIVSSVQVNVKVAPCSADSKHSFKK
jgi:hypothetical protein